MKFVATPAFHRQSKRLTKKYPSLVKDLASLYDSLEEQPFQGAHLGRNCYKIRLAITSKGAGKSGGGRVVTCVRIERDSIFLLTIYDKAEKEDLADKELDKLLKAASLFEK